MGYESARPLRRPLHWRPPIPRAALAVVRRLPFTLTIALAVLLVTAATGTMMRPITPALLDRWGFGLDDLRAGRLWPLLLTPFQVYRPYMVATLLSSLLLFVGACEYLYGTRRTLLVFWSGQLAGYLLAFLLLWPLVALGSPWAARLTLHADVGASAAGFAAAGAVIPALPRPVRRPALLALLLYLLAYLAFDQRVWDVEHLVAMPVGLAWGLRFLRQRGEALPRLVGWPRFGPRDQPALAAWIVAVSGLVNLFSAFFSQRHRAFVWLDANAPLALTHGSRYLTLLIGVALLLLASALAHGRRTAWRLTVAALAASTVLHLTKAVDLHAALINGATAALLLRWRGAFIARSRPPTARQGFFCLLGLGVALPLYGLAGFFLLRFQYQEGYHVGAALQETAARLLFTSLDQYTPLTRRAAWFLDSLPLLGWTGLLAALVLLLRGALVPQSLPSEGEQARRLFARYGASGTAYMTLWSGTRVFLEPAGRAYLGYRVAAGVALVLGDPIGPPEAWESTLCAFDRACRAHGWEHACYAATPAVLSVYERLGYRALKIGEEARIPLPGLAFSGKDWQDVRSALNRAKREGVEVQLSEGGALPAALRAGCLALADEWLAAKALPELGFTLGKTTDIDDPNVYVAVAVGADGTVHGFIDWLPMPAARGWVLDLMRRSPSALSGVMELLIGASLLAFQERGDQVASLAAAPLADQTRAQSDSALRKALGLVYANGGRFYRFGSLFAFKKKFQPDWQGVYLVYHGHTTLPRIALAILRAHLPELGPRAIIDLLGGSAERRHGRSPESGRNDAALVGQHAR